MLTSPKTRFLQQQYDLAKQHAELCATPAFIQATEIALLEMFYQMEATTDFDTASAAHQRMAGARDYVKKLLSLGTPATVPGKVAGPGELNYNA